MTAQILPHIFHKYMLDAIVTCVNDCQSLSHRVNSFMMADISCDKDIRLLIKRLSLIHI